jgi:hypothetical protein
MKLRKEIYLRAGLIGSSWLIWRSEGLDEIEDKTEVKRETERKGLR